MKRHLGWALASVALLASFGVASAADMAVKARPLPAPVDVWTGGYIGVNAGWAFDGRDTGTYVTNDPVANAAVAAGALPRNLGLKHEGGFGGGQAGYNWQRGMWVFGVEADLQGADIGRTSTILFPGTGPAAIVIAPGTTTARDHIDWFGTARGRIGIASNTFMFYGTGGAAFGDVESSYNNLVTPPGIGNAHFSTSDTRFGWAAGVGIEWMFAPKWSLRAEYLHVDLGSDNFIARDPVNFPATPNIITYHYRHDFDAIRGAINYHFGGPIVARY